MTGSRRRALARLRAMAGGLATYAFLAALAFVMVYPLLWMVAASFRPNAEIFSSLGLIPRAPVFDSYAKGWRSAGKLTYATFFANTFALVLPTVALTICASFLTAYGFARHDFRGKRLFFSLMIGCLLLPEEVLIVPKYLMYKSFGWLNTYLPFIVPAGFATYSFFIFLLIQFIRGIPRELDESAKIDGAPWFVIMLRIIMPLAAPALFSVGIFQFVWRWNDFFNQLIYINSVNKYTVSLALRLAIDLGETIAWNQAMAMAVLSLLPPAVLFFAAQRHFVEGVATTGLKG